MAKTMLLASVAAFVVASSAFAADLPVKAPPKYKAVPGVGTPCQTGPTSCTGPYVGAGLAGVASSMNIIGGGLDGSLFAGGGMPQAAFGYLFANGSFLFNVEVDGGYQYNVNANLNGQSGGLTGAMVQEEVDFGISTNTLFQGSTSNPNPFSLSFPLISPYIGAGGVQGNIFKPAGAWETGAGVFLDVNANWFIKTGYEYISWGSSTNGVAQTSGENLVFLRANYKF
jgi:opacity protein-like surface antigen